MLRKAEIRGGDGGTPIPDPPSRVATKSRWLVRLATGAIAFLILLFAIGMDPQWAERHILPDILVPSSWMMMIVQIERALLLLVAATLFLMLYRNVGRSTGGHGVMRLRWIGIALAVLLALPASELAMQFMSGRRGQTWVAGDEPLRRSDPLTGWTNIPGRWTVDPEYQGRPLYVIDAHGYRVAAKGRTLDRSAPSILFVGESIMFGKGLNWRDSMAGRVEVLSGIQSANLAVNAYSTSQSFMHLKRELPQFAQPVAVVILFSPGLMTRDLDRNRPWIDRAGRWHAAKRTWYLSRLGRVLFPYHSPEAIDEAVESDRRILMADIALTRARNAQPLVIVPVFQPEQRRERALREAIFEDSGIPHVLVPLDRRWRLFPDSHPDARAHAAMADAAWARLKERAQQRSDRGRPDRSAISWFPH